MRFVWHPRTRLARDERLATVPADCRKNSQIGRLASDRRRRGMGRVVAGGYELELGGSVVVEEGHNAGRALLDIVSRHHDDVTDMK